MPPPDTSETTPLLIACLCAQWCGTCKDYQPLFDSLQSEFPQAQFRWIDIEDESALVDPVEVEDFPTLLIATGKEGRFFGPVLPHRETLGRLIRAHATEAGPSRLPPEAQALVGRLTA